MFLNKKYMLQRRTLRNIEVFIFLFIFVTSLYTCLHFNRELTTYELIHTNVMVNLSCHYKEGDDALPFISSKFKPASHSIFFHDTSCKGGLDSRQLCAVESAARVHPHRQVYVLFSGPVSETAMLGKLAVLYNISNVFLARIQIEQYAADTPVVLLLQNGTLKKTNWGIENTSNILRFLTLYKFGGVYLDTDVVVVKSFDYLSGNWIAREDRTLLNAAAISLDGYKIGRQIASEFLEDAVQNYKMDNWAHNGPGVVTRVLKKFCGTDNVIDMTPGKCQGFQVLEPKHMYPIHYNNRKKYFKPGSPDDFPDAYIHHIWNRLTHHLAVPRDSLYAALAKKFCPIVYELYDKDFGN